MAWAPDYCSAADLKAWLRITDAADDDTLATVITAASRAVDGYCGRQFGNVSTAVPRYYRWDGMEIDCRPALVIDDLQITTDLAVSLDNDGDGDADTTLTNAVDFDLWPANATADGGPWTAIVLRPATVGRFNRYHRGVLVAARWGWVAVPPEVKQATMFQASRWFARRNAPFGVAGSPELGSELRLLERLDADLATVLRRLRRVWAAI